MKHLSHVPLEEKHVLRAEAHLRRLHQPDRDALGCRIIEQVLRLPRYTSAGTILCYVSFRSEVCTQKLLLRMREDGKRVVVPYCAERHLELFCLEDMDDLAPGTLGILEPRQELRELKHRHTEVDQIDLFVLPGLVFDRECGRIGYGKGYFDHLLVRARPDALLAAVSFECQVFPHVPMLPHDVRVDMVVTEAGIYRRTLPRYGVDEGIRIG